VTGHVFHPGHEALHGVTVVVEGTSGRTYVGRFHETNEQGVVMHDVGVHDPADAEFRRDAWLARQLKFGVRADHPLLVVPSQEAHRISRLVEWEP
jgi:hypothetical protein